jgi:hypothetical protein
MTKLEKLAQRLNDYFREALAHELQARFSIDVITECQFELGDSATAFLTSGRLVTTRTDKRPLTAKQRAFIDAYETGYVDAMIVVRAAAVRFDKVPII